MTRTQGRRAGDQRIAARSLWQAGRVDITYDPDPHPDGRPDPGEEAREGAVLDEPRFNAVVAALGPYLP